MPFTADRAPRPHPAHRPGRDAFLALTGQNQPAFVYREILADAETPVSVFAKLGRGPYSFLLESVVGGEKWAAYSFVGVEPRRVVRAKGHTVELLAPSGDGDFRVTETRSEENPLAYLDGLLERLRPLVPSGLPRFCGGAVGYLAYDAVRWFERLPAGGPDELGLPDLCFALTDTVVVFDNLRGTVKVVAVADPAEGGGETAYDAACARIDALVERLASPAARPMAPLDVVGTPDIEAGALPPSRTGRARFEAGVAAVKEYILAGDAFQVVLSQRFEVPRDGIDPFDVYRILRVTNPSPYMFHLEFPEAQVTGASPECLVRRDGNRVELRPIAGTRRRGATTEEDRALEAELRADPKERAEHVMLIDLGRNDVGRVSERGTVKVDEVMQIERYSHVMHIVSNVCGTLNAGTSAADVIKATFPAGTLSGAPKIRAMQIIDELEPTRRGIYGGAVGYISYTGNVDLAIAIRAVVTKGDRFFIQAGAGLVADSRAAAEHEECENKARTVLAAIERARLARQGEGPG
jgi:anthranilate synthase component 1